MKNILVTNDDGIYGPGLNALVALLSKSARVSVVVPSQERSGASHSITLHKALRVHKLKGNTFLLNGTTADCVRYGVLSLLKRKVDMVVSGINSGPNLDQDVVYSGTVAGAREGAMLGIPSIAVSVAEVSGANFKGAAKFTAKLVTRLLGEKFPKGVYLNVNIPAKIKGVRFSALGQRIYDDNIECRVDPRGYKYYWLSGKYLYGVMKEGTDICDVAKSYVSMTPLEIDSEARAYFGTFQEWTKNLK